MASAESWKTNVHALVTSEIFVYKAAVKADGRLSPPDYVVRGILPLLQFCVERDKRHVQKILNDGSVTTRLKPKKGRKRSSPGIDCMSKIPMKREESFWSHKYKALLHYENITDNAQDAIDPHAFDEWMCSHCEREIGNVYIRCTDCFNCGAHALHYICTDCFLAGRHFTEMERGSNQHKWVNSNRAHLYTEEEKEIKEAWNDYRLRFRWVVLDHLADIIVKCKKQLEKKGLEELSETEATIEYLRKIHLKIESNHL